MKKNRARSKQSPPETPGTVRERTLAHMEKLMRTATTVGAGIVLACGAKAQTTKTPQVCDPLPPPMGSCENPADFLLSGCLDAQTRWVKSGTRWTLHLSLAATSGPVHISFEGLKRDDVKVVGAALRDVSVTPRKAAFVLVAGAGDRKLNMQVPVLCNDKKMTLRLILDISKPPTENGSVPVRLIR